MSELNRMNFMLIGRNVLWVLLFNFHASPLLPDGMRGLFIMTKPSQGTDK